MDTKIFMQQINNWLRVALWASVALSAATLAYQAIAYTQGPTGVTWLWATVGAFIAVILRIESKTHVRSESAPAVDQTDDYSLDLASDSPAIGSAEQCMQNAGAFAASGDATSLQSGLMS